MSRAGAIWSILPLDSQVHDRSAFASGAAELDRYIRELASQDVKRNVARVFVATKPGAVAVAGYYSLNATSFRKEVLPEPAARRLPHYPVPAALLGRLAVDVGSRGEGLGASLLMDALRRVLVASEAIAVQALVVDARDDAAGAFYRKYGFVAFAEEPRRLFLPLSTLRQLVAP